MVGGLRVIAVEPSFVSGSLQNLFLGVWRTAVSRDAVAGLYGGIRSLIREWPGGVGLLLYVEPGTAVPPPDVRDFLIAQRREVAPQLLAAALAVEGEGLWSATVRTIAVTLGLASGTNYPAKSFSTLAEAAAWQTSHMGPEFAVPVETAVRAILSLRAQVAPPSGE